MTLGRALMPFLIACAVGCADASRLDLQGRFHFAFELHAFQPCGESELIWVNVRNADEPGWDALNAALGPEPLCGPRDGGGDGCGHKQAYAEITAVVTGGGGKGHLNKFDRELVLERIHRASATAPAACEARPPRYPQ